MEPWVLLSCELDILAQKVEQGCAERLSVRTVCSLTEPENVCGERETHGF